MDFRKTFFILPNLFTLASVFCGFYSIVLSAQLRVDPAQDEGLLFKAALAIVFGLLFDGADGRIARLTKTQSELGLQLDSLADALTFGLAPAFLVYRWSLEVLGRTGLFIAFLYIACGLLRLARFNVLAMRKQGKPGKFMIGLPIPIAANFLVAMILANHAIGLTQVTNNVAIAIVVAVLGYLMISRVRFRSMKDLELNKRTIAGAGAVAGLAVLMVVRINAPAMLLGLLAVFVLLGLSEEIVFYRRRRREEKAEVEADQPEDDEKDVLLELGYDDMDDTAGPCEPRP